MQQKTGQAVLIEQLLADGIRYMFGNPGTVEEGFLDELRNYPDMKYILALQESAVVGMADGYARATRKPAVVQLHSGVGLGNGVGMLYQAKRGHSPLVVLSGNAGVRYDAMDAQMAADLVGIAKPVTKWAAQVLDSSSVLRMLRRAIKIAATPPMGPVYLALPMDVLNAYNEEEVVPTSFPITCVAPSDNVIAEAAKLLSSAEKPLIILGDGVAVSHAQEELLEVANLLGAEVWGAESSEVNMSYADAHFRGLLGHMFGTVSKPITSQTDGILICGTYVFPEVFPALSGVFANNAKIIHIDLDDYEIAKNFPVTLGIRSDPKLTLSKLAAMIKSVQKPEQRKAATQRNTDLKERKEKEVADLQKKVSDAVPLTPARFMKELADQLTQSSRNPVIFDEALTSSGELVRYLPPTSPGHYFATRGGSLGVGFPGAIGAKLANPEKLVIGFSGDGGCMYTIPALWTAAHYRIGAKFVVCNNTSYELLKLNIQQYWRDIGIPGHAFPSSFDINQPSLRFDQMALSMGIQATRVERPGDIGPAIQRALADDEPFLIDLVIAQNMPNG